MLFGGGGWCLGPSVPCVFVAQFRDLGLHPPPQLGVVLPTCTHTSNLHPHFIHTFTLGALAACTSSA